MNMKPVDGVLANKELTNSFDAINTSMQYRCLSSAGLAIGGSKPLISVANSVNYLNGGAIASRTSAKSITSITSSSTTATVTETAHGYLTDDVVTIAGAVQTEYNGTYVITKTGANTYTYTFAGSVTTPATGTKTATLLTPFTATTHDIAANSGLVQEAKYLVCLDSAGLASITMGAIAGTGASLLPDIPASKTPVGYVLVSVAAGSTKFDATSDNLDAGHLTVTYVNLGFVAPRFDSAQ